VSAGSVRTAHPRAGEPLVVQGRTVNMRARRERTVHMRAIRLAGALVAIAGLAGLMLTPSAVLAPVSAPASAAPASGSAVTVAGHGQFATLRVTVGQTKDLINQTVQVSWTGGTPTEPRNGVNFSLNYLQIMQCWGDAADGPTREQCEFGATQGLPGSDLGGYYASTRAAKTPFVTDPHEHTYLPTPAIPTPYVPFRSVTGKTVQITGPTNEFYDSFSSNEQPFARTYSNGAGQGFFEVLTSREAPGLGCGAPRKVAGATVGRSCWLVVVPRGSTDADGSTRTSDNVNRLDSSPLSQSNWDQRLVVKLQFAPIGGACSIGTAERPTAGQELVAEAVTRWQPALCALTGRNFGYSQVPDDIARHQLGTDAPGLEFVSRPAVADALPAGALPVYAPVAVSGPVIAFNVDRMTGIAAPPDVKAGDGARMPALNLNARLVAKLLTQSYRWDVADEAQTVAPRNPNELTVDPEFLDLNPEFKPPIRLLQPGLSNMLLPFGQSDGYRQIWDWVNADPAAKAFLAGTPDPHGMVVNPAYELNTALTLPRSDFPKTDPYCRQFPDTQPPRPQLCTLDLHPYAADMHDAARSASRGDPLLRTVWDPTSQPPSYKRGPVQPVGSRRMLAVTDAATAARFDLPVARLQNASGAFVAPTGANLLAGLAQMKPGSVPSVREPNPHTTGPNAYPLTTVTYASTVPSALTAAARTDYASFLRYAAGAGQQPGLSPGQLSPGYAPLPADLRAQTRAAATALLRYRPPVNPSTGPSTSDVNDGSAAGSGGGSGTPSGNGSGGGAGAGPGSNGGSGAGPAAAHGPGAALPAPPTASPQRTATVAVQRTQPLQLTGARFALLAISILGGLAAGAGPTLLRYATRARR
jgi:uncharacterized membrane protein YgcG